MALTPNEDVTGLPSPSDRRQDLIDAIVELTQHDQLQTYGFVQALFLMTNEQLGRLFDAMADYDDVRHRARRRRS